MTPQSQFYRTARSQTSFLPPLLNFKEDYQIKKKMSEHCHSRSKKLYNNQVFKKQNCLLREIETALENAFESQSGAQFRERKMGYRGGVKNLVTLSLKTFFL